MLAVAPQCRATRGIAAQRFAGVAKCGIKKHFAVRQHKDN